MLFIIILFIIKVNMNIHHFYFQKHLSLYYNFHGYLIYNNAFKIQNHFNVQTESLGSENVDNTFRVIQSSY